MEVRLVSRFYKTPCFPANAGDDFINAAASVEFFGTPYELLNTLHEIEAQLGRQRKQRWAARTIDIDLVAFEGRVLPDVTAFQHWRSKSLLEQMSEAPDQLILPHPRLHERAFVLVPLNDVAPDWLHPVFDKTVADMLAALPEEDVALVVPFEREK